MIETRPAGPASPDGPLRRRLVPEHREPAATSIGQTDMSPQQQLQVYVDPEGRRLVEVESLVAHVERDIDRVEAELMAAASDHEGDVRARLEAGIADAIAATRERLAQQAEALRTTGRRLA